MFLPEVCKSTGTTIVAEYLGAGAEAQETLELGEGRERNARLD